MHINHPLHSPSALQSARAFPHGVPLSNTSFSSLHIPQSNPVDPPPVELALMLPDPPPADVLPDADVSPPAPSPPPPVPDDSPAAQPNNSTPAKSTEETKRTPTEHLLEGGLGSELSPPYLLQQPPERPKCDT